MKSKQSYFDPQQMGTVKRHPDGFGFFIPDNPSLPDVYIPRKYMDSVMTNDKVMVLVRPEPGGERFRGEVVEILGRNLTKVVGQIFQMGDGKALLRDESHGWGEDLLVDNLSDYETKAGDWCEVQISSYPGSKEGFCGKVTQILGDAIDPQTDSKRALATHNIPSEFSSEVLAQAKNIPTELVKKDYEGRKDLRELPFMTIDGVTAKDFDDAIYIENSRNGFKLFVAIADVSHYVKPGTPIDKEAYNRGTSTYFPNFVNPMLPEALSNEMCSLKPRVDRLAMVAEIDLSFEGEIQSYHFYEAVIYSHARVTYGQAQEIIEGVKIEELTHVREAILRARDLAKILLARRQKEGTLELHVPETVIEVDETGEPIDIIRSDRLFSHQVIEEMMLTANVAVARFFRNKETLSLFRIHEPPNEMAIDVLKRYLWTLGVDFGKGGILQKRISKAIEQFRDKPQSVVLNMLALRSMSQAKYSSDNVGHFGLGFEDYAHFTSPIRRYPDLIVHRTLKALVHPERGYSVMSEDALATAGTVLSAAEQRSVKAERFINSIKQARFMARHIGEEFTGIISSVTKFGVFVLLRQYNVDGLVRIEELANEYLEFDEENLRLVGRKSGFTYSVGDELRIVIADTNIDLGQIDFSLAKSDKDNIKLKSPRTDKRKSKSRARRGRSRTQRDREKSTREVPDEQPPKKKKSLLDYITQGQEISANKSEKKKASKTKGEKNKSGNRRKKSKSSR